MPLASNVTLNLPNTLVVLCEISGTVSCQSSFLTDVALCSPLHILHLSSYTTEVFSPRLLSLRYFVSTITLVFTTTFQHFFTFVSIIIFVRYYFTFDLPKWFLPKQNNSNCTTLLAPAHYLFQGLGKKSIVIHIAVSSTYPRLLP